MGTDGAHRTKKRALDDRFSRFLDLEATVDDADESEQQEEEDGQDGTSAQV